MRKYLPDMHFSLHAFCHGAMMVHFNLLQDREVAVEYEGNLEVGQHILILQRPEDCEARFVQDLSCFSEIDVVNWPSEHRTLGRVITLFMPLGFVTKIDEECIYEEDHSSLRLVLQYYLASALTRTC